MSDAALRVLDSLRDPDCGYPSPVALEAFARLLAGPTKPEAALRWASAAIAGAPPIRARADAFRAVYQAAQEEGLRIDVTDRARRHGSLVLEGVFVLPPRERAILALSCVLGFTIGEVAHVVGGDPSSAVVELEQAVMQLRDRAEEERSGYVA